MNYIDKHGRHHIKPVTATNPYPTNNAYIYSFYAKMVGLPVSFDETITNQLDNIMHTPLTRHPGDNTPAISHDEYVGAAGIDNDTAFFICKYGEINYWQFCDQPNFTPTQFRKLVLDDVLAAYEELANDPETNVRRAVVKYPALYPIAFWHRPEQQYFYYRCAGRSPGIIRTLYFIIASIFSIYKKDGVMFGFKMLKLKRLGPTIIEKAIIKLHDRYGKFKERCIEYFPDGHPILKKVLNEA